MVADLIRQIGLFMDSFQDQIRCSVNRSEVQPGLPVIGSGVIIASFLWLVMFQLQWYPFWPSMICSTALLAVFSLLTARRLILWKIQYREIAIGAISGIVLYFVFYFGNIFIRIILPDGATEIDSIYRLREDYSHWFLVLTLIIPIGPGEELFWRGLILGGLTRRIPTLPAICISSLIYAGVHFPSMNATLVLAALTGGIFWGLLYIWRKSILAPIVSHTLWDILVFVYFPLS